MSVGAIKHAAAPATQASDFSTICAGAGVLKCVGFDSATDISHIITGNSGLLPGNGASSCSGGNGALCPLIDTTTASSGAGSLKFTIPVNTSGSGTGAYFTNFSTDLSQQFGANSQFYIQWKQMFDPNFLAYHTSGDGFKQELVGSGDTASTTYYTCTDTVIVQEMTNYYGFSQMYDGCNSASTSHSQFDYFYQTFGSTKKAQNGMPSPYCLLSQYPNNFFPPNGNCFQLVANQWMTFETHVTVGPRGAAGVAGGGANDEFVNSYVELWIALPGQPATRAINWGPYNLTAGSSASNQKFGKVFLLPYNTSKAPDNSSILYTWYDSLVISSQSIPVNGYALGSTTTATSHRRTQITSQ